MAFKESLEMEADEKTMKTIFTTDHELIFDSKLKEFLGFTKKRCLAGTLLGKKPTSITSFHKVQLKGNFVDSSRKILQLFGLNMPRFAIFKSAWTAICKSCSSLIVF